MPFKSAIQISSSSLYGGGFYNAVKMDLRSTLMQQNQADSGAAIYVPNFVNSTTCSVTRDVATAAPSEIDDNVAGKLYSIEFSTVLCTMHDTIGSGIKTSF